MVVFKPAFSGNKSQQVSFVLGLIHADNRLKEGSRGMGACVCVGGEVWGGICVCVFA